MSLYQKILELQKEVTHVSKDSTNTHFRYKYVSESHLIDKVMEAFSAKGLIVIPDLVEMRTFELLGKPATEVLYEYTVIDVETGESLKSRAGGMEQGDKCAFKAMTGANKYYWLRFLQISTGDDPEKEEPKKETWKERRARHEAALPEIPIPNENTMHAAKINAGKILALQKATGMSNDEILFYGEIESIKDLVAAGDAEALGAAYMKLNAHVNLKKAGVVK